jgi:hypothetical protein
MHAVAQHILEYGTWKNSTLVVLGIRNEQRLHKWMCKLDRLGKDYSKFYEPDIDNQLTAIACADDSETLFKRLELL